MEILISVSVVLALTCLSSWFMVKQFAGSWDERGDYGFKGSQWKKVMIGAVTVASVFTSALSFLGMSSFISISLGALAFFLIVAGLTDARTMLIPKELSSTALVVGLMFAFAGFFTSQYYEPEFLMSQSEQLMFQLSAFGFYMLAISMMFVLIMFVPAIGFGDIKMFWAVGLFMASFMTPVQMLALFMCGMVIMFFQMIFAMVKAKSWKVGGLPALPAFAVAYLVVLLSANIISSVSG